MAGSGALAHPSLGALPPEAGAAQRAVAAPTHSAPAQAGATCRPRWQGCYLHALARARVRALSAAHLVRRQVEKTKPVVPLAADMRWAGERRALRCRDVAKSLRQPIAVCVGKLADRPVRERKLRVVHLQRELHARAHAVDLVWPACVYTCGRGAISWCHQASWHTWQYPMRGSIQCVAVSNARLWSYETIGVSRRAVRARYRHTRLH
jgi:hypothetical protein